MSDICNSDDDNGVDDLACPDTRAKRRKIGGGGVRNSFADRLKAAMERGNTPGESILLSVMRDKDDCHVTTHYQS